ncbi:MAG TPA: hypothetical protein VMZ22_02665 [Acidimicrobiales bacterium]|nr:hypothetical protein [Acidimicrobiales bacterium]
MSRLANRLAPHYARFGVTARVLLTGHSHQAWPDVALAGYLEAFDDAARHVDDKWERAFAQAERVRAGYRRLLGLPTAEVALGSSTFELVVRFLSALDLRARPRLVTTAGEFHTVRRLLGRLGEEGVDVVRVPVHPIDTLAERIADAVDGTTAAALVSSVLFESARIVENLPLVAAACEAMGAELLVDAYHHLGVVPFEPAGLEYAWIVGGGYKYLQLGEGNCFLRLPSHADSLRPVVTGWYAEYAELADSARAGETAYPNGAARFAGATYDPVSHYRAARVFDFFAEQGLTIEVLRATSLRQTTLMTERFDNLRASADLIARDSSAPRIAFGGFLALRSPHAATLRAALARRGVHTDHRGDVLRLGPAPYVSDTQLHQAMDALGAEVRALLA